MFEYVRESPLDEPSGSRRLPTARSTDGSVTIQRSGRDFETGTMRFEYRDNGIQCLFFVDETSKSQAFPQVWQVRIAHMGQLADGILSPTAEELSGFKSNVIQALETWPNGDFERFRHNNEKLREVEIA